jgi:hypothetical protein
MRPFNYPQNQHRDYHPFAIVPELFESRR